jgi:hypothetical protein
MSQCVICHLLFAIRNFVRDTNAYAADQILDYLKEEIACVLDTPEKKVVEMKLTFTGREEEKKLLEKLEADNVYHFFRQNSKTKQFYTCPIVHGSLGVGKSRLGYEFNRELQKRHPNYLCGHITLDFSLGDAKSFDPTASDDTKLAFRVLAHFFFGESAQWLVEKLAGHGIATIPLTFSSVMNCIAKHCNNKPVLLAIQLDEFGYLSSEMLNQTLVVLATHLVSRHDSNVCLLPMMTGTTTKQGIDAVTRSQLSCPTILL